MPELHVAATLGILLAVSLTAGLLSEALRLPKVTAYLGVGIIFGPSVLDLVPQHQVEQLDPLLKLAIGLVLYELGNQFTLSRLKVLLRRVIPLSAGELSLTFVLVSAGVWAVTSHLEQGLLLGALALATAPATTLLVLKEAESEGPVTDLAGGLVALNNFASIVVFETIFLAVHVLSGTLRSPLAIELLLLARDVGGSLLLGALMGLAVSFACGLLKSGHWLVLLVAANAVTLGLCESFQVPYMLAFLAMGIVVVNTSDRSREIRSELRHLTGLLTVTFFVIHGAELHLAALVEAGLVGGVYVATRAAGKYFGVRSAARMIGESSEVRSWLGPCLLAQAGAAIALSSIAVERDPELGGQLQTIILGTVVVFELAGPVLIRHSIRKAGEIPVAQAILHKSVTPWQQLADVWLKLRTLLGFPASAATAVDELTVDDVMRPHAPHIRDSATLDEVVDFVQRSRDDTFPVTNEAEALVGVIRYQKLSRILFAPFASTLIRAVDIADAPDVVLRPEDSISDTIAAFRETLDDCIPVVGGGEGQAFRGMVRRRDVTNRFARHFVE